MQTVIEDRSISLAGSLGRPAEEALEFPGLFRRHVAMGSTLFQPGEPRQLYRVESGALCHYIQSAEGPYLSLIHI